jgi:hypothetical protein
MMKIARAGKDSELVFNLEEMESSEWEERKARMME